MNKKGFTLIELLSVIVLIGIVLSIGVLGVSSIRTSILEKQYKNIKIEIELAGEKYYTDTESTQMYVQTLIDEGYLKTDNESKKILDPRNSKELNCHIVNISTTTEKATLDERDSDCNETLEENYAINIRKMDNSVIENKWYKEVFKIKAVKKDTMEELSEYTWTTDLNPNVIETGDIFDLNNLINDRGGAIEDTFYVSAISQSGKVLKSGGTRIKIDTVKPIIEGDIKISNKDTWAKEKAVSITLTDIGSGIKRYIFDSNSSCSSPSDKWTVLEKSQNRVDVNKVFNSNGTFYFCAEDEAGNKIDSQSIIIEKVDATPPECYYEGEMTNYTTGTRNIKYGCYDSESGCQKITLGTNSYDCLVGDCKYFTQNKTYTGTIITASIESTIGKFRVIDKLGNYRDCPVPTKKDLNIYLDNTAPNISITSMSYSSGMLYVNVSLTDSNSGAKNVKVSFGAKSVTKDCNGTCSLSLNIGSITSGTVTAVGYDNVGNSSTTSKTISRYNDIRSGEKEYSGSFTDNIPISGNYLDKNIRSITGTASCNNSGTCTIYPKESTKECLLSDNPRVENVKYDTCADGGSLDLNEWCDADDKEYTNKTGSCTFEDGTYNGDNFDFQIQCNCACMYGPRWKDIYIRYYCPRGKAEWGYCGQEIESVGVDPSSFRDHGGQICYNIASVPNFGTYSGSKIIYADKTCRYDSYKPNSYCPSYEYTKYGSSCYKCSRGSFNSYTLSCEYMGICTVYKYSYEYTYYMYN